MTLFCMFVCPRPCTDPAETAMVGAPADMTRSLSSFELRCPRGTFVVAISGVGGPSIQSIGPLSCSDGTGAPILGFGQTSTDGKFTTKLSPDGFVGLTLTGTSDSVSSLRFYRNDQTWSATYGTQADVTSFVGRRQFVSCPNYGVAIGVIGLKSTPGDVPVQLGLICSGLPCPVRKDTMFGPAGAGGITGGPGGYLRNSPDPIPTATATQCCGACTNDFRWVFFLCGLQLQLGRVHRTAAELARRHFVYYREQAVCSSRRHT
jgi:hypothetical protein